MKAIDMDIYSIYNPVVNIMAKTKEQLILVGKYKLDAEIDWNKHFKASEKFWRKAHRTLMKYGIGAYDEFQGDHKHIETPEAHIRGAAVKVVGLFVRNRADNFDRFSIEAKYPSEDGKTYYITGMEARGFSHMPKPIPIYEAQRGIEYLGEIKKTLKRQA